MGDQSQWLRSGLNVFPELPSELCTQLLSRGSGWVPALASNTAAQSRGCGRCLKKKKEILGFLMSVY